jgi:hypothetical protein
MPPGVKELRSLRLKAEDTPGNLVAPRFLWRGPVEGIDDQREITTAEENVGIFGGTDRSYTPKLMAELPLAETEVTYEQIADIFQMCGFGTNGGGNRAGSAQGASGSTVIFTLPIPASTHPITYSYTAEVGDTSGANNNAEVMPYALCKELTLTGAGGAALKMEATLIGRYGTATNAMGSYSNAGTLVQVEEVLAGNGTAYMAPVTASFGAHPVTPGNILGCKVTFTPRWEPKFPVDAGITYFHTAVFAGVDIEGELTMEYQISGTFGASGSAGVIEKWRQEQPFLLRMQWPGGAIAEGTTYLSKLLRIDVPIKIIKAEPLDDQNGNDIRIMTFESRYNESNAAAGRGTVTIARLGTSEFAGA